MVNQITVGMLQTNCWIIPLPQAGGACLLADPGADGGRIIARLEKLHLRPRYIVLTHSHLDHLAALPELAAAFPGAAVAIHRSEAARLGPHSLEAHRRDFASLGDTSFIDQWWKPLPEASLLLDGGESVGPFTVLHLPGHSPGSIGLYWEAEKILVSGDTLFNSGVGRTDLPGGSQDELKASMDRLFTLDGDTQVYPGHGPATTIRRERGC